MTMYLNDSVQSFEFVLEGELTGDAVQKPGTGLDHGNVDPER